MRIVSRYKNQLCVVKLIDSDYPFEAIVLGYIKEGGETFLKVRYDDGSEELISIFSVSRIAPKPLGKLVSFRSKRKLELIK